MQTQHGPHLRAETVSYSQLDWTQSTFCVLECMTPTGSCCVLKRQSLGWVDGQTNHLESGEADRKCSDSDSHKLPQLGMTWRRSPSPWGSRSPAPTALHLVNTYLNELVLEGDRHES
jgi:hypothetical protein